MDLEDLPPAALVRDPDLDLSIEPAGAAQGGVNGLEPIRRTDHHHIAPPLEPVHQRQELSDDALFPFTAHFAASRGDGVELVDEDDGRRALLRPLEHRAQPLLRFAIVFPHDLRAVDGGEAGVGFVGHRPGEERLPRARRPVQENTAGGIDPQPGEQLRVLQGQLDGLLDLLDDGADAADVIVGHDADRAALLARVLGEKLDPGLLRDPDDPLGDRVADHEPDLQEPEGRAHEKTPQELVGE